MSLDLGTGVSDHAAGNPAHMEEEDYCQFSAQRFQAQWTQQGVFSPAVLRHFGVRGEYSLVRSLSQSRSFSASFGFCSLGCVPTSMLTPLQATKLCLPGEHASPNTAAAGLNSDAAAQCATGIPFAPLAFGQYTDGRLIEPSANCTRENLAMFFGALQASTAWARELCGVVTIPCWDDEASRTGLESQLQLASFLGIQAVLVPLPCVAEIRSAPTSPVPSPSLTGALSPSVEQRQTVLLCQTADRLRAFVQGGSGQKIWVRCDACAPSHRHWFQLLLRAFCYGYDIDASTGVHTVRAPGVNTVMQHVRGEALMSLSVYLSFGDPQSLLSANGQRLSAAWLGEDVVAFDAPPAVLLREHLLLRPTQTEAIVEGTAGEVAESVPRSDAEGDPNDAGAWALHEERSEPAHALDDSVYQSLFLDTLESRSDASFPVSGLGTPRQEVVQMPSSHSTSQGSRQPGTAPRSTTQVYRLPADVVASSQSRWGGLYDAHTRLEPIAFIVELLRRRAAPVFRDFFFDHYSILNYLYFKATVDIPRDMFMRFEDSLQLPLQPLGHQLSSGVYEVFERDSSKYSAYRDAIYAYICDWLQAGPSQWHATANRSTTEAGPPAPSADPTLYLVLLGCGRGPLIDECLSAASALGVRVRLFAVEKNPPAADFARLRAALDPEWAHLVSTFGHSIEVITANGLTLFDQRGTLALPPDFGLCDVVVSELLGSFGDNELSPECLEGFYDQLRRLQQERQITPNPHTVSIPQSYTAWLAPLHSVRVEQAVAEASIKGFTVRPPNCPDAHAALYHSYYVCNLSRGALLAAPQRCWTFEHRWDQPDAARDSGRPPLPASFERSATLHFAASPHARCSGFAGFFSAVLYAPRQRATSSSAEAPPQLSTLPASRTRDMYSWFPCVFALEPSQAKELSAVPLSEASVANSKSASVGIHVCLHRRRESHRAWYTWQVAYGENSAALASSPVMNERGWASTIQI